jgi:hypothetical protein
LGREERLFVPDLADAKALSYLSLQEKYPNGSQIKVWYNPKVTGELSAPYPAPVGRRTFYRIFTLAPINDFGN